MRISGEEIRQKASEAENECPKDMQNFYHGFREGAKWMQHELSGNTHKLVDLACDAFCDTCESAYKNTCEFSEDKSKCPARKYYFLKMLIQLGNNF